MALPRSLRISLLLSAVVLTGAALHQRSPTTPDDEAPSPRNRTAQSSPEHPSRASAIGALPAPRVTPEPAREIDPFGNPVIGKPHIETSADGAVMYGAELAPGYEDALPIALPLDPAMPQDDVRRGPGEPPPGHQRLDPTQYGYKTMPDMERDVRRGLHVPDGYRIALWGQERNGRQGVAIEIVPPEEVARERAAGAERGDHAGGNR